MLFSTLSIGISLVSSLKKSSYEFLILLVGLNVLKCLNGLGAALKAFNLLKNL